MTDTERTGAFLAQKRKKRGLTQLELADRLGVTNRAVSKWETGAGLPGRAGCCFSAHWCARRRLRWARRSAARFGRRNI